MTQLIPSNLPVYFQCLSVPTEWTRAIQPLSTLRMLKQYAEGKPLGDEQDEDFLRVKIKSGIATAFDPWEKRNEFLRLTPGDTEALLKFLPTVGLFESAKEIEEDKSEELNFSLRPATNVYDSRMVMPAAESVYKTRYCVKTGERRIWSARGLLKGALQNLEDYTGQHIDFQARIVHGKDGPRVLLTTTTFLESLFLTLAVDRVRKAKVRKCARPDCGVPFSITGGHKRKYCEWYCGHIESVRKARRKMQKASKGSRQSSQRSVSSKGK